jgi:hypothetical protein
LQKRPGWAASTTIDFGALVDLRNIFQDASYREQERQVTYALERRKIMKKLGVDLGPAHGDVCDLSHQPAA